MEGLGLVAFAVMQLAQFGQGLGISGDHTDDLHEPLDGLMPVIQKLIPRTNCSGKTLNHLLFITLSSACYINLHNLCKENDFVQTYFPKSWDIV